VTSQPAELGPLEKNASVISSLFTQSRGRIHKAAATCNDLDDDKNTKLHYAYPILDEVDALASEVQDGRDAIVDGLQPPFVSVHSSLGDITLYGSRNADINEAHSDSPRSPTDSLTNTYCVGGGGERSLVGELRDPDHPRPSDFPSLDIILRVQQADGKFNIVSGFFKSALRQKYKYKSLRKFLTSRFGRISSAMRLRHCELAYNICLVVYITHEYASSKALWELQVAKARQWIKWMIIEWLKESGDSEEKLNISLEESAESMLEKMEKVVLQQT
jgi:hypothetical protein